MFTLLLVVGLRRPVVESMALKTIFPKTRGGRAELSGFRTRVVLVILNLRRSTVGISEDFL